MTTKELSDILKKHEKWIEGEEGGERANLTDADLRGADLGGANLKRADLTGANLTDADLTGANLRDADLTGANLTDANLTDADLTRANLVGADLTGANLRRADLTGANLVGADLMAANLRDVNLKGANLVGANLDYSVWPLWCGSLDINVDKRIVAQLAYHFCRLKCDDPEYQEARDALSKLANQFHRIDECGRIEDHV